MNYDLKRRWWWLLWMGKVFNEKNKDSQFFSWQAKKFFCCHYFDNLFHFKPSSYHRRPRRVVLRVRYSNERGIFKRLTLLWIRTCWTKWKRFSEWLKTFPFHLFSFFSGFSSLIESFSLKKTWDRAIQFSMPHDKDKMIRITSQLTRSFSIMAYYNKKTAQKLWQLIGFDPSPQNA